MISSRLFGAMKTITLATCSLNQWALDFHGNTLRVIQSIEMAKNAGARYRLGPELEVSGYSCEDHFLEPDTYTHSWECLADILKSGVTKDIFCDIGMPVVHRDIRYNCRVLILDEKVKLIRPKMFLANDGNYRERRFFHPWEKYGKVEDFQLPAVVQQITGQQLVPIGDAIVSTADTSVSCESCEELFTANSPHVRLFLNGVDIIGNGSGSHHQLRKLNTRVDLIQSATSKSGGVYLYSNQQGCDGNRLYFDGSSMIMFNGKLLAQGSQFSLKDVEVLTATIDLDSIRSYRGSINSRGTQASNSSPTHIIRSDFRLVNEKIVSPTETKEVKYLRPEEEVCYGPACWLWDYLRRSSQGGFFLPLSGGADSGAVAAIVGAMCQLVVQECQNGNLQVIEDVRRLVGNGIPATPQDLAKQIFFTSYLSTTNSSEKTLKRAENLAKEIGSTFFHVGIDEIIEKFTSTVSNTLGASPRFTTEGGTENESLALQNIQARSRMAISYMLGQLIPWSVSFKEGKPQQKNLLILGSSNVDEALRGYYTKYDCSSADLNPIGSVSKMDLKLFLKWGSVHLGYPTLLDIAEATPTAELMPVTSQYTQSDEDDMGMTYRELGRFGILRKINFCGPVSMFQRLVFEWNHLPPKEVATKVKRFFFFYSVNRHKMTTLTPSYHAESYSPDDNRYDLRQFLYNSKWTFQFQKIDELVEEMEKTKSSSSSPSISSKL